MKKYKNTLTVTILLVLIPLSVIGGLLIFKEKAYAWISLCVALLSCLPPLYAFERRESSSKELTVLAVLVALSACGRFVFAWLPGFKPITAITVIVAVCLGKEAGFVVGSLSAVVSNFYFGQGPWTPFQMFAWGMIGFIAGVLPRRLKNSKLAVCVFGALAGILYSLTMDIWTTVSAEGGFNVARYITVAVSALPITAQYAASNVIFLLLLSKPVGEKLDRLKKKYGMFITDHVSEK